MARPRSVKNNLQLVPRAPEMVTALTPKHAVQQRLTGYLIRLGLGTAAAVMVAYYVSTRLARGRKELFGQVTTLLRGLGLDVETEGNETKHCGLRLELAEAAQFLSRPLEAFREATFGYLSVGGTYFPYITRDYPQCDDALDRRITAAEELEATKLKTDLKFKERRSKEIEQRKRDFETFRTRLPCRRRVADTYCEVGSATKVDTVLQNLGTAGTSERSADLHFAIQRALKIKSWSSKNKLYGVIGKQARRRCDPRTNNTGKSDCGPHPWSVTDDVDDVADDPHFKDQHGMRCQDWAQQENNCDTKEIASGLLRLTSSTYNDADVARRKKHCPKACPIE